MDDPRGTIGLLAFLGWIGLGGGLLLWLVGRTSGPSPGSEWPVLELVGPVVAGVGLVLLLIAAVRRARRR